jgi:hypothetical protein
MALFEVAMLLLPTEKQAEEGKSEELILKPEYVVANDSQTAAMKVAMDSKENLKEVPMDRIKVLVRPFV